ncbi:MAG TPA: alkaline phosphatase family protein [Jatrophihabitans sp.]|uniref:alkaline phosphatase family protein n=1 Tax=Jatrophihabitans sp. TaxID=1932789 RepID=UPI002F16C190
MLLAVDGVGLSIAEACWPAARCESLVTTFPSTSTTAWLTALTGAGLERHLVPGMVFQVDGSPVEAVGPGPANLIGPVESVFSRLRAVGVRSSVIPGMIADYPGPWSRALWQGASLVAPTRPAATPPDPRDTASQAVADIDAVLATGADLVIAYVDIDSTVHQEGYSDRVQQALAILDSAAIGWRRQEIRTMALSDHGATEVRPDAAVAQRWTAMVDSGLCDPVSGGAGRVRWLHSCPGQHQRLLQVARDALGDVAWVASKWEVAQRGWWPASENLLRRVGDVVAVATAPAFPVPQEDMRYEHGSITPMEMLIPFAVW